MGSLGDGNLERVCVESQHEPGGKIAMMALVRYSFPRIPHGRYPERAVEKAFERAAEIFANYLIESS